MEPELFKSAIESQFQRLKQEKDNHDAAETSPADSAPEDSMDLTISGLNTRVKQLREAERRATVRYSGSRLFQF